MRSHGRLLWIRSLLLLIGGFWLAYQWLCLPWQRQWRYYSRQAQALSSQNQIRRQYIHDHFDAREADSKFNNHCTQDPWLRQAETAGIELVGMEDLGNSMIYHKQWRVWELILKGGYQALFDFLKLRPGLTGSCYLLSHWLLAQDELHNLTLTLHVWIRQ